MCVCMYIYAYIYKLGVRRKQGRAFESLQDLCVEIAQRAAHLDRSIDISIGLSPLPA